LIRRGPNKLELLPGDLFYLDKYGLLHITLVEQQGEIWVALAEKFDDRNKDHANVYFIDPHTKKLINKIL